MSSELTIDRTRLCYRPDWTPVLRLPRKKVRVGSVGDEREPAIEVLDEVTCTIPIASTELEVIETYLGSLIDQLLGRAVGNPSESKGED